MKTAKKSQTRAQVAQEEREELARDWGPKLTQAALVITIAVVVARALMTEVLRDALEVRPGSDVSPRGAGAGVSLVMDLICCVPAMLVMIRRLVEKGYPLRLRLSHALLITLAAFAAISTFWASDKYAAAVTSANLVAGAVLVWSTTQLVRSWLRLRLVTGVCFGLLLAYAAQGAYYKLVDAPTTVKFWNENKDKILRQRGWDPESYTAIAFEHKLLDQEMIGFNQSQNSFAAAIVMLLVVSAGAGIQRVVDGEERGWVAAVAIAASVAAWILYLTGSMTSAGTIAIALILFMVAWRARDWMASRPRLAYAIAAGSVVVGAVAVIGHGIVHHGLPGASLNFRWRYWTASEQLFERHALAGVGWGNFGPWYLGVRLPVASEEIRDPHNIIVRAFVELGMIGGVLLLAWMARAAWELTRPVFPANSAKGSAYGFGGVGLALLLGVGLNSWASLDWSGSGAEQQGWFIVTELFRRLLYLGLIVIGTVMVTIRSSKRQEMDDRPAPWALYGTIIAAGVFLVHNLVDFSIAEPGPLTIFCFVLGGALGVRTVWTAKGARRHTKVVAWTLAASALAWLVAALALVIPVIDAEQQAAAGDEALRTNKPELAAELLRSAYQKMPLNADYAFRSARAMMWGNLPAEKSRMMLETAIARDPSSSAYWLLRGALEIAQPSPDAAAVRRDFEMALKLDPNNVEAHNRFGDALAKLGDQAGARKQYEIALEKNAALEEKDKRRLPPDRVREIEEKIKQLR